MLDIMCIVVCFLGLLTTKEPQFHCDWMVDGKLSPTLRGGKVNGKSGGKEDATTITLGWADSLAVAKNAETRRREPDPEVKCECLIRWELRGRSSDYVARIASTWLSIIRIYSDGYSVVILYRHSRFVSSSCRVAFVPWCVNEYLRNYGDSRANTTLTEM